MVNQDVKFLSETVSAAIDREMKLLRLCYDAMSKGVTTIPIAAVDVIFGWSDDEGVDE